MENNSNPDLVIQEDSQIGNGRKRQARKSWDEYTPHYKRQKLKNVKEAAESVLRDKQLEVVDMSRISRRLNQYCVISR